MRTYYLRCRNSQWGKLLELGGLLGVSGDIWTDLGNLQDDDGNLIGGDADPFKFGRLETDKDLVLAAKNVAVNSAHISQLLALLPNYMLMDVPANIPGLTPEISSVSLKVAILAGQVSPSLLEVWWTQSEVGNLSAAGTGVSLA
jgi:hypothetical protein